MGVSNEGIIQQKIQNTDIQYAVVIIPGVSLRTRFKYYATSQRQSTPNQTIICETVFLTEQDNQLLSSFSSVFLCSSSSLIYPAVMIPAGSATIAMPKTEETIATIRPAVVTG